MINTEGGIVFHPLLVFLFACDLFGYVIRISSFALYSHRILRICLDGSAIF